MPRNPTSTSLMRGSVWLVVALTVTIVAVLLTNIGRAQQSLQPGRSTIRLVATEIRDQRGFNPLRLFLLSNPNISRRPFGHGILTCQNLGTGQVLASGVAYCTLVITLPRGKIVAAGLIRDRLFYEMAVLGGTGYYMNAQGEMSSSAFERQPYVRQHLILSLQAS